MTSLATGGRCPPAAQAAAAVLVLLACTSLASALGSTEQPQQWQAQRRSLRAAPTPTPAGLGSFPLAVQNECWSDLTLYLVYNFDTEAYDGANCTNVPQEGLCQEYLFVPGTDEVATGAPATAAASYPTTQPTGWLVLEDNDAYAMPANVGADVAQFVDVMQEPCTQGSEGCLPKFEVDASDGLPIILTCRDRFVAAPPAGGDGVLAEAPAPAA